MAGWSLAWPRVCGHRLPVRLPGKPLAALMFESKKPVPASTAGPAPPRPVQPDRPALGNRSRPARLPDREEPDIYA